MLKEIWSQKFVLEVLSTYFTVKTFHWARAQSRPLTRQSESKIFSPTSGIFFPRKIQNVECNENESFMAPFLLKIAALNGQKTSPCPVQEVSRKKRQLLTLTLRTTN